MVALHPFLEVVDDGFETLFAGGFVVELFGARSRQARHVTRGFDDGHLHAQTDPQIGDFLLAGVLRGLDLAFGTAFAKPAGHEDRVEPFEVRGQVVALIKDLCIDPFDLDLDPIGHATVSQRLCDGFIGVFKLGVFADDGDFDLAFGVVHAVRDIAPDRQFGLGCGGDIERVQHGLIQPLGMIGQRRVIDGFQVIGRNHGLFADVTEKGNLLALFLGDRVF